MDDYYLILGSNNNNKHIILPVHQIGIRACYHINSWICNLLNQYMFHLHIDK